MNMATLATHAHHNTNELPARHNVTYVARTNMHAFIITSQFVEPSIIISLFIHSSLFILQEPPGLATPPTSTADDHS